MQFANQPTNVREKYMNVEKINKILNEKANLAEKLGMEFFSTPDPDTCIGTMPVDERTVQPFGYLSGGASLALAETIAGVGSCSLCPDSICVGLNVNANHIHPAKQGDTVTATARIIHKGRTTHVWQVDIRNTADELISSISVTNYVIEAR